MNDKNERTSEISIIIPVMNEGDNIKFLAAEISKTMNESGWSWECIWIDDDSTDDTREKLKEIRRECSFHSYLFHCSNYGQSAALVTGFRHAKGETFVTLDGDGQNDPANIPLLVKALLENNADMVNGWRMKRRDNIIRRFSSRLANGFRNILTGEHIRDVGCSIRAFRRECVKEIVPFKGMHRFFPTMLKLSGYNKIIEIPVNHRPRHAGKTKYGINNRLWVGILDVLAVCWMRKRLVFPKVLHDDIGEKDV